MPSRKLDASEAFVGAALDAALDAIVGMDHEGKVIEFSRAAEEMFGYARHEVLGKTLAEIIIPPSLRKRHRHALARYLKTSEFSILGQRQQLTAIRAGGAEFPVELTVARLELDGPPRFVGFIRDITERRQWEEALAASQAKYQDLYDHAPDLFVSVDATNAKVIDCNQTTARVLGYTKEELLGREIFDLYHPSSLEDAKRVFRVFVEMGELRDVELQLQRKDGTKIDVNLNASAVRDEQGKILYSRSVWRDVSERKRAERERRSLEAQIQSVQKLESLGVLAGGIAHDFNNLLMGVLGNASLALRELSPAAPARKTIQQVKIAAKRAAELCDQMLAYSGRGRFVVEPINLSQIVEEVVELLIASVSKKIVLQYDLADDLPAVQGDATQIRQIIMNLITNASEASGSGSGAIQVATGTTHCDRSYLDAVSLHESLAEGDYVYLEVSDTGCGMDAETRRKLFDPFFTTKFSGRGLGLAAVLGILRGHKGAADVQSEPGRGTRFRILLPALAGLEPISREESVQPGYQPRGARVLVVDDQEMVRNVATAMLEAEGFAVVTATEGREAIEILSSGSEEIECVILDLTMPQMDGRETFEELRRIQKDVRVILSSGYDEQDITARFPGDRPEGFLKKPYDSEQLVAKLREVLRPPAPTAPARPAD